MLGRTCVEMSMIRIFLFSSNFLEPFFWILYCCLGNRFNDTLHYTTLSFSLSTIMFYFNNTCYLLENAWMGVFMYHGSLLGPTNFWHIPFLVIVAFFEISAHSDNFQGFNKEIHSFGHTTQIYPYFDPKCSKIDQRIF